MYNYSTLQKGKLTFTACLSYDLYCCEETPWPWQFLKTKTFHWSDLQFQMFNPLSSWWDIAACSQAYIVLEKELRVRHLDPKATGSELFH